MNTFILCWDAAWCEDGWQTCGVYSTLERAKAQVILPAGAAWEDFPDRDSGTVAEAHIPGGGGHGGKWYIERGMLDEEWGPLSKGD